jgi:rhodanese-related sulfurtransferase
MRVLAIPFLLGTLLPAQAPVMPSVMSAAELATMSKGGAAPMVIDVRPAWQFTDWHIAGAVNVQVEQFEQHVRSLPVTAKVVLVDRDGDQAMALGGFLLARLPERSVSVLSGGLQRYYREVVLARAATPTGSTPMPSTMPVAKKRSAGC